MRLALIVEYEGTDYHGFQYQVDAPSIQGELEKAIARLTGEKPRVVGAGRTDAGVHAKGQVAAFKTSSGYPPETFVKALNFYLPEEVAVRAAYQVHEGFDPRREALSRTYRYTILNSPTPSPLSRRTAYLEAATLDMGAMQRVARLLVGRHDFSRFAGPMEDSNASTEREIYSTSVTKEGDVITFDVEGSSFLPHQVRRMTGALVDLGRGALTMDDIRAMIDGGPCEAVAHSLPPRGLCLMAVTYADFPPGEGRSNDDGQ